MKALILSDIHSNICALEAIWDQEWDSDVIYCTGDLVDYGPFPKEVLDWIREHQVICTQGNHDRWLVKTYQSLSKSDRPAGKRAWIDHNIERLVEDDIDFLAGLPLAISFQIDSLKFGMTHLYDGYDEITNINAFFQFRRDRFPGEKNNDLFRLVLGHTHRQGVHYLSDEVLWLNPGSVSYRRPDDPDQTAHYVVITDGTISLKRLPYDLSALRQILQTISLVESEQQAGERFFGDHSE